ncbi:MAG: homocysteine S-methyltransferase family protein, partial [Selenomonas bovis]|nr:homocysteine S-methyltransferase family protein [Selenomonas bovis]
LPLLDEARAILTDLRRHPEAVAWISFSCRDDAHTCGGDAIADCARLLDKEPQVAAIGVNCTAPQHVAGLIRQIRQHTAKPIVVYPNTGETYDAVTKTWHGSPTPYGDFVRAWYAAGARLIGGCCRTTPDDIRGIAAFRAELQHG